MAGAWTRKEGKSPSGGLNAKGRASLKAEGHNIKAPQPEGGSRKDSFRARMCGMKEKLTSAKTAHDPNSRINLALKKAKGEILVLSDGDVEVGANTLSYLVKPLLVKWTLT
jgi:hypothetical protein